ncbi:hypothetical protein [Serratia sp. Se-RSBMAAmG]|uniref:hypothetical protein n=1 Tax=Serratia sp. Se-RSBMAAmG TaxID=3043305 RepID=UPI0024AF216D|nr:hypothetical protein [Serratia sp. Se-RSBMAAmG]MDI6977193.1 hypothetical protein [Serratia sp. Se-RSBMAAmG]
MNMLTIMCSILILVCLFMAVSAFKQSKAFKNSHPETSKELRKEAKQFFALTAVFVVMVALSVFIK